MNLTFITVSTSSINTMIRVYKEFRQKYPETMRLSVFYAAHELNELKREKMKKSVGF